MADCMTFPATFYEFAEEYKIVDSQEIYTNGTALIPIFRVEQWLDHQASKQALKHGEWIDKWDGKYANPAYVCSNCGEKALLESYITELDRWRYRQSLSICCPHCGAKMDGRSDTNNATI